MQATIPLYSKVLAGVPEEDRPKGEELLKFYQNLSYEAFHMIRHAATVKNPQIVFSDVRVAGSQYIWEFYVNDLSLPRSDSFNWHGQNVSQWLYAGCILLSDGRVSTHH